ncbi:MAG: hypothetical protein EBZ49_01935 [Proteobacteria bacterium]|nr:hypothetical protein [Pseudomonadota bacterium]
MINDDLNEANALLFAAKHYDNPLFFDTIEFYEDLSRFKYLKKLFSRYEDTGDINERLVLNHLTIIYNVFGVEAATRLLFLKMDNHGKYLKPFLLLLNYLPEVIYNVQGRNISTADIPVDQGILEKLKTINDQTA